MKNKILKILSLLAICTLMIASLCSFTTTTQPYDYVIYESRTQIDMSYRYNRNESNVYYGTIPSCNRVLIDPTQTTISGIRDSIKFYGSDLYMGNSTKSIDIQSFTVSTLNSALTRDAADNLVLELCYKSDDTSYSVIHENFAFWNFNPLDCIFIYLYDDEYNGISTVSDFYLTLDFDLLVFDYISLELVEVKLHVTGLYDELCSPGLLFDQSTTPIDVTSLFMDVLESEGYIWENLGRDFFVQKATMNVAHLPIYSGDPTNGYGAVKIKSEIVEKDRDGLDLSWFDLVFDEVYSRIELLDNQIIDLSNNLAKAESDLAAANKIIKDLRDGDANVKAIPLLFDGIYKTIYNTLTIFFNMDFFGTPLGNVVSILLGAAVVIVILKVVL